MSSSERNWFSIGSLKRRPIAAIGIVPKMISQVSGHSGRRRAARSPRSPATNVRTIAHSSRRKYTTTASIVPSCTTAVKAAPGSSQPRTAGTMRRCALLEIGRNSVRPWTIPRTMAWSALMRRRRLLAAGGVAAVGLPHAVAVAEAAHGLDRRGRKRRLELAPQPADRDLDLVGRRPRVAPHELDQLLAAEDLAGVADE